MVSKMDIVRYSFALISIIFMISRVSAQCPVERDGKCFETTVIARNLILQFRWDYLKSVDFTPEIESYITDYIRERFIIFSNNQANRDLGRTFCADPECPDLSISAESFSLGERVRVRISVSDVNNILSETPVKLAPDVLLSAATGDVFDLPEDNPYGISSDVLTYNLASNTRYCEPGRELVGSSNNAYCGECVQGDFLDVTASQDCIACPIGTFQNRSGQEFCYECTPPQSTASTGSTNANDCKVTCIEGEYVDESTQTCIPCELGTYQPLSGEQQCLSCPEGQTTFGRGSTDQAQCLETCDPGYSLLESGACEICPVRSYLENPFVDRVCIPCLNDKTTPGEGATSQADCNTVICGAGEEREGSNPGACNPCPQNTYKSETMAECESCGDVNMWRTDSDGSTAQSDCKYYCPAGYFIDSNGEDCVACPHDTYKYANDYYARECTSCPESRPKTASSASTSDTDCKYARCDRGYVINAQNTLQCQICDYGSYQPVSEPIFQTCQACSDGKSTRERGAVSSTQCEEICESGFERKVNGDCVPCNIGYYKDNTESIESMFGTCQMCDVQFITDSTASTSASDCDIRNCSLGFYRRVTTNACIPCEKGTYQDELYATGSCKTCPVESTTEGTGAVYVDECSVATDRRRVAFRIKLDMDWILEYFDPDSTEYQELKFRILAQVDRALQRGVTGYRQGLKLRSLSPGSVDAHLVGQFYSADQNVESELEQTLADAVNNGQISNTEVNDTSPLPIDPRASDPYAVSATNRELCPRGDQFNYASGECEPCPVGWYQRPELADVCLQCPDGYSTDGMGAVGLESDACLLICGAGLEARNGVCSRCPRNQFKETEGIAMCEQCADNLITVATGSMSADDCIAACQPGLFSNSAKRCESCPRDTYNPLANQIACQDCPTFTTTESVGSTAMSQCLDTCEAEEPCKNGGTCAFDTIDGSYQCTCTPQWQGDTCEDRITTTPTTTPTTTTITTTPTVTSNMTMTPEGQVKDKKGDNEVYLYAAIAAAAGFIVIVIILVVVCILRRRRKDPPSPLPKAHEIPPELPAKQKQPQSEYAEVPDSHVFNNNAYAMDSEDSFVITTPNGNAPSPPKSPNQKPRNGVPHATVSSIPDILAPQPPRSVTTVNISDAHTDQNKHGKSSASSPARPAPVSTGFDPVPDSFSMPMISNPLLADAANNGDTVFINGVATLPPPGASWDTNPPPYSENATEPHRGKGKKKKKKPKQKHSKHVLIDTQRNMVHTFKSTASDTSSMFGLNSAVPNGAHRNSRPGLRRYDSDGVNDGADHYETIPGDRLSNPDGLL